jgi:hypothetical protein
VVNDLILSNPNRIAFLILDGLGDIPNPDHGFMIPLESAGKHWYDLQPGADDPCALHALKLDKYGA